MSAPTPKPPQTPAPAIVVPATPMVSAPITAAAATTTSIASPVVSPKPIEPVAAAAPAPLATTCISYNTKDINVGALPAAMSEYEKILVNRLTRPLMMFFEKLYKDQVQKVIAYTTATKSPSTPKCDPQIVAAIKQAQNNADLILYQQVLDSIPNWLSTQLEPVVAEILQQTHHMGDSALLETLKIMFISKAVLMASVKPGPQVANACINLDLPTLNVYIHRILTLAGKELKRFPSLLKQFKSDTEISWTKKRHNLKRIVQEAISEAIHDMFPFDHIVSNYLMTKIEPEPEQKQQEEQPVPVVDPIVPDPTPMEPVASVAAELPAAVEPVTSPAVPVEAEPEVQQPKQVEQPQKPDPVAAELGLDEQEETVDSSETESDSEQSASSESETESESSDDEEEETIKKKKHHKSKSKKHHKKSNSKKHHHKHKKTSQKH